MYSDELTELALAEEPMPGALIHKVLREATLALADSARALRLGAGRHRRAAAARRRGRCTCPARPTCRRSKASNPKKPDDEASSASPTRTSRSAAWSSRFRPTATAICTTSASTPAR